MREAQAEESPQNLREDVGEDSASAVVVFFDRCIDANHDGQVEIGRLTRRVSPTGVDAEGGLLHWLEVVGNAEDIEGGVGEVFDFFVVVLVDEVAG